MNHQLMDSFLNLFINSFLFIVFLGLEVLQIFC